MNRRLPRPARLLLRAACTLFALALLYLLAAAALGCVRLNTARPPVAESRITIYLLSNGLHMMAMAFTADMPFAHGLNAGFWIHPFSSV